MSSTRENVQQYLEAHCKVFKRGTTWRTTTPAAIRSGSDDNSFSVTFNGDEHGTWHDHVSKEGGSLYNLAEKLGIELPERAPVEDTKRKYDGLADYAIAHGVTEDVFKAAGWSEGEHHNRPCIIFPTANGRRYRFTDDSTPAYINDTGYTACLYGVERAVKMATEKALPLVICNGEASTVVAQHFGIPAFCKTNGEAKLPELLLNELRGKWSGKILIAMDCDETGRKTANELQHQLDNSEIIDLQLSNKGDLADFCKLHEAESLTDLLALATSERPRKTAASMASERLALVISAMATPGAIRGLKTHMPSIDKAFSGLVGGRSVCIYGDTGMGKSTLCASWAVQLGTQAPGLIFSTEIFAEAYLDKLACAYARVPFNKLEDGLLNADEFRRIEEAYTVLSKMQIEFEDISLAPELIPQRVLDAQRSFGCGWVVMDSISKIATGVDYEKVTAAANAAQIACTQAKLPVIVTSQVGRNLKTRTNKIPTLHDAQGSGMIEQNSDIVLALYNHNHYVANGDLEPDDSFPPGSTLVSCLKDRWRGNTGKGWMIQNIGGAAFFEQARTDRMGAA